MEIRVGEGKKMSSLIHVLRREVNDDSLHYVTEKQMPKPKPSQCKWKANRNGFFVFVLFVFFS